MKESLFHFPATMSHHRRMNTITTRRGPELFAGSRFIWHLTAEQNAGQASLADVLVRPGTEPPCMSTPARTRHTSCSRAR
jgi:hypothetical protein